MKKAALGYDPNKCVKSNGTIRKEDPTLVLYEKLQPPPPVKGKHKFTHCQCLYEQVHKFLANRSWAHAHPESTAGGITWTEVFILFDTRGGRTTEGQHVKSPAAMERATKRRSKDKTGNIINTAAIVKPTLDEEIKQFKAICRYILHNDLQEEQRKWFRMESRPQWRRLALLGIEGNQPAMSAFCETTEEEDESIAKAILMQKVGANPKETKAHTEMTKARSDATDDQARQLDTFYNKARAANGAAVRWKRSITEHVDKEEAEQGEQGEGDEQRSSEPRYTSRILSCIRCGHPQETSWMQLRVKNGFRAIRCRLCSLLQLCSRTHVPLRQGMAPLPES